MAISVDDSSPKYFSGRMSSYMYAGTGAKGVHADTGHACDIGQQELPTPAGTAAVTMQSCQQEGLASDETLP